MKAVLDGFRQKTRGVEGLVDDMMLLDLSGEEGGDWDEESGCRNPNSSTANSNPSKKRHNQSQARLRALQNVQLRISQRLLLSHFDWHGPSVQTIVNARKAGLIHHNVHILGAMNCVTGMLVHAILPHLLIPGKEKQLWELLQSFELKPTFANTVDARAGAMLEADKGVELLYEADERHRLNRERLVGEFIRPELRGFFGGEEVKTPVAAAAAAATAAPALAASGLAFRARM